MHKAVLLGAAILVSATAGLVATPAAAGVVVITGTRQNVNPLNPVGVGRCGAGRSTVNIQPGPGSSTGTSNFGDFTSTQSHCLTPPPPASFDSGVFTYNFASGASLFGTYSGALSLGPSPGVFDAVENLVVTGGSGEFLGATGEITTMGTLQFIHGNGVYSGALSGLLDAPGVPEPANWALMTMGLGLAGATLRRRRRPAALARAG
jgi:hypothetical protein